MRQLSDTELHKLELLTKRSVELTLIEPTQTGLQKSIMDATGSVRSYLKSKEIHCYHSQIQGPEHKVQISSFLLEDDKIINSIASLYRPNTKNGDPRIWFKGLGEYAKANDILGIIVYQEKLYVLNLTRLDIAKLLENLPTDNPMYELVNAINDSSNAISNQLLTMLRKIALHPVPSLLKADTSVGRTLEDKLGIAINSSKQPDYKGIELKSFRKSKTIRKNLFAQVPDWNLSKFKSSNEILEHFGYQRGDDFKLYCTVSTIAKNSQGLKLKVDSRIQHLIENSDQVLIGDFIVWELSKLHKRLLEKHNETFWISASTKIIDGREHFLYQSVEHTKKPIVSQFDLLLEQGIITVDHLIKKSNTGKVVEKGPIFKIKPSGVNLLFPPSEKYALT